ncbi:MAG: CPBP family intramembrane metalloprotease [Candidatus Omnitrophica bacterium]|nr:CPBP family intramembrane metalloprotease [Candidatus Omnitrophota bacterium]
MGIFMNPHEKKKFLFYTCFAVACFAFVVLLELLVSAPSASVGDFPQTDPARMRATPPVLFFLVVYFGVFFAGLWNLGVCAHRKLRGLSLFDFRARVRRLPVSAVGASQIFFFVAAFLVILQIVTLVLVLWLEMVSMTLAVILNFALQVGVVAVLLRSLSGEFLNVKEGARHTKMVLRLFTASLPLLLFAVILNAFLVRLLPIEPSMNPAVQMVLALPEGPLLLLFIIQGVILAPLAEELFFRVFAFKLLRRRWAFWPAAALLSSVFAVIHRASVNILPLFVLSMVLCYLYEKTQSAFPPILFHAVFNGFNFIMVLLVKAQITAG